MESGRGQAEDSPAGGSHPGGARQPRLQVVAREPRCARVRAEGACCFSRRVLNAAAGAASQAGAGGRTYRFVRPAIKSDVAPTLLYTLAHFLCECVIALTPIYSNLIARTRGGAPADGLGEIALCAGGALKNLSLPATIRETSRRTTNNK